MNRLRKAYLPVILIHYVALQAIGEDDSFPLERLPNWIKESSQRKLTHLENDTALSNRVNRFRITSRGSLSAR